MAENRLTALITGASKRIGFAIAYRLAETGFDMILHYRSEEPDISIIKADFPGTEILLLQADLLKENAVQDLIHQIPSVTNLAVVVNNAASFNQTPFFSARQKDYIDSLNNNALIPFLLARELCLIFPVQNIINIIDTKIVFEENTRHPYHVSKRLLFDLTQDMALALAPSTRVNAICPGPILPPDGKTENDLLLHGNRNPLKKTGNPGHITLALEFLLQNDFITGQTIFIDGGQHLYGNIYAL